MGKPRTFYKLVSNRPGQDVRYSVDSTKLQSLGWKPKMTLDRYLPICRKLNEKHTRNLPLGKKRRILKFLGLEKTFLGQ